MAESPNEDPRKHPPKKWVSDLLGTGSILALVGGTIITALGALAISNSKSRVNLLHNSKAATPLGGLGILYGGMMIGTGIAGLRAASYIHNVRKENYVEGLEAERERLKQEIDKNTRTP
jgi:hypothetical protein